MGTLIIFTSEPELNRAGGFVPRMSHDSLMQLQFSLPRDCFLMGLVQC